MSPDEVRIGLPVVVAVGPADDGVHGSVYYRRGTIIGGPRYDLPSLGGRRLWRVAFPSGALSWLTEREMEPADAVTRLGTLRLECRVEQEQVPGEGELR